VPDQAQGLRAGLRITFLLLNVQDALRLDTVVRPRLPAWLVAVSICLAFLAFVIAGRMTGHWATDLPDSPNRCQTALRILSWQYLTIEMRACHQLRTRSLT
jgi:hypothetical protein